MSSEWNNAIQNYLGGRRQAVQEALETKESMEQAQAGLVQAKTGEDVGMAGESFADKLREEGNKFQADMLTDISAAGLAPTVLKGAARLATARAGYLQSPQYWRKVQARRFAQQEGLDPDEAVPADEGTFRGAANDAVDALRTNVGDAVSEAAGRAGQVVRGVVNQARSAFQRDPMPIRDPAAAEGEEGEFHFSNPVFEDPEMADPATMGIELPEGAAGNITRGGQMIRQIRGVDPEMAPAQTSQRMGDAMNEALGRGRGMFGGGRGDPVPGKAPPGRGQADLLEGDPEVAPGPGEVPAAAAPPGPGVDAPGPGEVGALEREAGEAAGEAQREAAQVGGQAEEEAGAIAEDLAPEITAGEAASGWSSLAGALGDVIPLVGFGLGAWALGTGIKDEIQNVKDAASDPYGKVRGEIAAAQGKISGLEANVSADQFASKLGAGSPSFGSLAARPTLDTSQATSIALHV